MGMGVDGYESAAGVSEIFVIKNRNVSCGFKPADAFLLFVIW